MKVKFVFIFLYLIIFPSLNVIGISLITTSNATLTTPQLSVPDYGTSNYNISQSVLYQVELNFSMIHTQNPTQEYYFKAARLDNRQPNASLTPFTPPYQESKIIGNTITGWDFIEQGSIDKFNNTYDLFNSTLGNSGTITLYQKYNITLNEIYFNEINNGDIGSYNPGDEIHTLYNVTEEFYEADNPTLVALSNNIVNSENNTVEKARKIFNWIVSNIDYQEQDLEIGALEAYNQRTGDCSDISDLMITLLRIQSIPARKITGFVISNYPSHRPVVGDKYVFDTSYDGSTQTASHTNKILGHAWLEYYIPQIGWIACDPTWGQGYFNRIDFLRFNVNVGAWFHLPGASPGFDYVSEFPFWPSPVCSDHSAYDWEYTIEITVLETDLFPLPETPIFVTVFIMVGFFAIISLMFLLRSKRHKKLLSQSEQF
jgi:hypothetical protein